MAGGASNDDQSPPSRPMRVWEDVIVGFVFISYSSTDRSYVELLVGELSRRQLEFWYDRRIDSGDRWTQAIEAKVRECAVFVPVVSPGSVASEWCERELHLADRLGKPMAPLLLDGGVPIMLITRQHDDVSDRALPNPRWFEAVAAQLATECAEPARSAVGARGTPFEPRTDAGDALARTGVEHTTALQVSPIPPATQHQARPSRDTAISRRAALVDALQHPLTLVCVTAVGFALIYLLVLSNELGMRVLSVAAVVVSAVACISCVGLHYWRGIARQRRIDDERRRCAVEIRRAT